MTGSRRVETVITISDGEKKFSINQETAEKVCDFFRREKPVLMMLAPESPGGKPVPSVFFRSVSQIFHDVQDQTKMPNAVARVAGEVFPKWREEYGNDAINAVFSIMMLANVATGIECMVVTGKDKTQMSGGIPTHTDVGIFRDSIEALDQAFEKAFGLGALQVHIHAGEEAISDDMALKLLKFRHGLDKQRDAARGA